MKLNKLKYLLPALLFALPACTEDEDLMQNIQGSHASGMEFTAVNGNPQSLSKTTLNNGWDMLENGNPTDVLFTNSDRIGVFSIGETAADFAVKGLGDNGRRAIFAGEAEKAAEYFALYPYQSGAKIDGNKISANIPTSQEPQDNNMDGKAALSVAYTTAESKTFAFQNVTAMIAFRPTAQYSKITVEALDGTKIAGNIAVEVSKDGGKPVVTGGTESKITLEGYMSRYSSYCLMLKPGTIKKGQLKFTFTKNDGTELVQTNEKDVTLEAGVCYNYGYIGTVKLTVYDGKEVSFVKYIDPSWNSGVTLPEIPCNEKGYVYVYNTAADGTGYAYISGNWFYFTEETSLYLQKVKGGEVKIYDPEGTNVIYTKTMPIGFWFNFPYLTSADDKYYAFSSTKGGKLEYHRGDGMEAPNKDEVVFYAVLEDVFTVTIYGNGANAEPTFKQEVAFREGLYLPHIDDPYKMYAISENGDGVYNSDDWINVYEDLNLYLVDKGVNHYIVVHAGDIEEHEWDSQFWFKSITTFHEGDEWEVSMMVKADKRTEGWFEKLDGSGEVNVTGIHTEVHKDYACGYLHWAAIGTVSFDTEWRKYTASGIFNNEQDGGNFIAFSLNDFYEANNYYFDQISFKVNGREVVVNGGLEDDDYSAFFVRESIPGDIRIDDCITTANIETAAREDWWQDWSSHVVGSYDPSYNYDPYRTPKTITWTGLWAGPYLIVEDDWAYVTVEFDGWPAGVQFCINSDFIVSHESWGDQYQSTYPHIDDATATVDIAAELEAMQAKEGDESTKITKITIQNTDAIEDGDSKTAILKSVIVTLKDGTKKFVVPVSGWAATIE